ncbi:MAG: hypothetical protein NVSMB56_14660 [Pyrinomonadaceae bacterium]
MSSKEKIINAFRLFNKKTFELEGSSFIKKLFEEDSGVSLSWKRDSEGTVETKFERKGPNKESIKAFVLDFRFFIQDNERSSFRNIAKHYSDAPITEELKTNFNSIIDQLNQFLDAPSPLNITYNNNLLTRREIMDTFIYGGLEHANDKKEQLFNEWRNIPPLYPVLESEFVSTLAKTLVAIDYIKDLNESTLKELE